MCMLDNGDLRAIREIVKEEVQSIVMTEISASEQRTKHFIRDEIRQNNQYLVQAVGTMLEDNFVPQFNEVHRELRLIKTTIGLQA